MVERKKGIERNIRKLLLRRGYLLHTSRAKDDFVIMKPIKQFDTLEEVKAFTDSLRWKVDKPIE